MNKRNIRRGLGLGWAACVLVACSPIFNLNFGGEPGVTPGANASDGTPLSPTSEPVVNASPDLSPPASEAPPSGSPPLPVASPSASALPIPMMSGPLLLINPPLSIIPKASPSASPSASSAPVVTSPLLKASRRWVFKTSTNAMVLPVTGEVTAEVISTFGNGRYGTIRVSKTALGQAENFEHGVDSTQDRLYRQLFLNEGQSWTPLNVRTIGSGDSPGINTISVPAGVFDCKLEILTSISDQAHARLEQRWWYSANEGLIKYEQSIRADVSVTSPINTIYYNLPSWLPFGFPGGLPALNLNQNFTTTTWELTSFR